MKNFDPIVIPFILRPDVIVRFHGIPHDMTPQEAERISTFIRAFANPLPAKETT